MCFGQYTVNKVADHANVTTDIATMEEEILDENKAMDSEGIVDLVKGIADKVFGHAMTEIDDGRTAGKEIVVTANENVVEQVSHTTTHI